MFLENQNNKKRVLFLDAGHGIDTKGKRGPVWEDKTQSVEWILNKEVCDIITEIFSQSQNNPLNIEVVDTKQGQVKDIPLGRRVRFINDLCRTTYKDYEPLLISVHFNASEDPRGRGWECWVSHNASRKSELCAKLLFKNTENDLNFLMRRGVNYEPFKRANFYIIKNSICPAVLTENGFMTNREEHRYINSKEGKVSIAKMIVKSVNEYFQNV